VAREMRVTLHLPCPVSLSVSFCLRGSHSMVPVFPQLLIINPIFHYAKIVAMNFLMRIIVTSVIAFGLSYILRGVHIDTFWAAIIFALVLAILNAIVKPILILLTLPITILTFGLFLFVINAAIILLTTEFVKGFRVDGFWWALLFSLLLSIITSVLYKQDRRDREESR
jgi:putative membrane protein